MGDTLGKFMTPRRHADLVDPDRVTPPPPLSAPAELPEQPAPPLGAPAPIALLQPAPSLSVPSDVPLAPTPPLSVPSELPPMPPPPLSQTGSVPFMPAPPLSVTGTTPFMPAPPLSAPGQLPPMPPPPLGTTSTLPPMPAPRLGSPAELPEQAAPVLSSPAPVSEHPYAMILDEPVRHDDVIGQIEASVRDIIENKRIDIETVIELPGIGSIPIDAELTPHSANVSASLDLHLKDSASKIALNALTYASARQQAAKELGLAQLAKLSSFASKGGAPTRPAEPPATTAAAAPLPITVDKGEVSDGPWGSPSSFTDDGKVYDAFVNRPGAEDQQYPDDVKNYMIDARTAQNKFLVSSLNAGAAETSQQGVRALGLEFQAADMYNGLDEVAQQAPGQKWKDGMPPSRGVTEARDSLNEENRYASTNQSSRTSADSTPEAMDLRYLNDPAIADSTKRESLLSLWDVKYKNRSAVKTGGPVVTKLDPLSRGFYSSATTSAIPVGFSSEVSGSHRTSGLKGLPDDDEAYVPLVFTDLRSMGGVCRSVYFRPFIKSLSESKSPKWSMQSMFGRVDPVATYQGTDRTISLSFKVIAMSPGDLLTMYQKISWLDSMVYPEYLGGVYNRGPVVRMRVGDLINALGSDGFKGLPGVITSLEYSFDEATWELEKGKKLPRSVDVSLSFHVLHEVAIGLAQNDRTTTSFGGMRGSSGKMGESRSATNLSYFRHLFGSDVINDPNATTLEAPSDQPPPPASIDSNKK